MKKDQPRTPGADPGAPRRNSRDSLAELAQLAGVTPDRLARMPTRELTELALRLPARQRIEFLLHSPRPMRMVRSVPDSDLYVTIREVGPFDALPLLRLASASQIHHLLDLESWRRDRFDPKRAGAWVSLLVEAGEAAIVRYLRTVDDEELAFLLRTWARVEQLEYEDTADKHGHGLSDAGTEEGFSTPDGYYRFSPVIPEHASAIARMLQIFYVRQPERYQQVLWSAMFELPSELEERALHWRQSRLEEHGFPSWIDAAEIYAPPRKSASHAVPISPEDPDALPASRSASMILGPSAQLGRVLEGLEGQNRERVLHGFASLANHLLMADQADTGDPDAHRSAMRKGAAFVSIALDHRGARDVAAMTRTLTENPVIELFREGHGLAAELAVEARAMQRSGWASCHDRAFEMLDAPIGPRIEALLERRPRYVEIEATEGAGIARDFHDLAEIEETRASLEMARIVGELFVERMGLEIGRWLDSDHAEKPTFSTLLLTVLAWHATSGSLRGEPLPQDVSANFLREVASRRTAPPDAASRAMDALIVHLGRSFGIDTRGQAVLRAFGRFAEERLRDECGGLDPGVPPDPRFVTCLLLESIDGSPLQ